MPPYIVLRVCQKIYNDDYKTISNLTSNITAELEKLKSEIGIYNKNNTTDMEKLKSEIIINKINTTAEMNAKQINMTG
jgi:hypothetical protein